MQERECRLCWIVRSPGALHHDLERFVCGIFTPGGHAEERQCNQLRQKRSSCHGSLLVLVSETDLFYSSPPAHLADPSPLQCSDEPCRRGKACQIGDRIPADQHALRRDDMELLHAGVQIEPCLADFTLAVTKDA